MARSKKDKSGVYLIQIDHKFYIGSAKWLNKRKYDHLENLRKNKHHSSKMQNAYNKYGIDKFTFTVIQYIDDVTLLKDFEQYYLDMLFSSCSKDNILNICRVAYSSVGLKRSAETVEKLRLLSSGRKHSDKTKALISEQSKGRNANVIYPGFYSPTGILYKDIRNLTQFCRQNNINTHTGLLKVNKGQIYHFNGWTKYEEGKPWKPFYPDMIDLEGNMYTGIYNLNKFCKIHNLISQNVGKAIRKGKSEYKGWKFIYRFY